MQQVESLLVRNFVVYNTNSCYVVDNLSIFGVVQVITAIVATITIRERKGYSDKCSILTLLQDYAAYTG